MFYICLLLQTQDSKGIFTLKLKCRLKLFVSLLIKYQNYDCILYGEIALYCFSSYSYSWHLLQKSDCRNYQYKPWKVETIDRSVWGKLEPNNCRWFEKLLWGGMPIFHKIYITLGVFPVYYHLNKSIFLSHLDQELLHFPTHKKLTKNQFFWRNFADNIWPLLTFAQHLAVSPMEFWKQQNGHTRDA